MVKKNEVGGMCYMQDEQDVNKAFWLENFQENTLESGQIRCVHLGVKI
jgi:hypothetical protein